MSGRGRKVRLAAPALIGDALTVIPADAGFDLLVQLVPGSQVLFYDRQPTT